MNLLRTLLGALTISSFYLMMQAPITATFYAITWGSIAYPPAGLVLIFGLVIFAGILYFLSTFYSKIKPHAMRLSYIFAPVLTILSIIAYFFFNKYWDPTNLFQIGYIIFLWAVSGFFLLLQIDFYNDQFTAKSSVQEILPGFTLGLVIVLLYWICNVNGWTQIFLWTAVFPLLLTIMRMIYSRDLFIHNKEVNIETQQLEKIFSDPRKREYFMYYFVGSWFLTTMFIIYIFNNTVLQHLVQGIFAFHSWWVWSYIAIVPVYGLMADAWYKIVTLIGKEHRGWHITSWMIFSCFFNGIGACYFALATLANLSAMINLILQYVIVIFGVCGFILMRLAYFLNQNQATNQTPAESPIQTE